MNERLRAIRGDQVSKDTTTILAAYREMAEAEADWDALEAVAKEGLYVADAALVNKDVEGDPQILERQSHHGWGKGAMWSSMA